MVMNLCLFHFDKVDFQGIAGIHKYFLRLS